MAQLNEDCNNSYDHSSSNTELSCQQFANVVHESKSVVVASARFHRRLCRSQSEMDNKLFSVCMRVSHRKVNDM